MLAHTDMERELDSVTGKCIALIAKCFTEQGGNATNCVKKLLRQMWFKAEENERMHLVGRIEELQTKFRRGK